jgi:predicted transcriptional regulator
MSFTIDPQQFRTVTDIRSAIKGQQLKVMHDANAEVVRYRHALGISQKAMAERMGFSLSLWKKLEVGKRSVPECVRQMIQVSA